VLRCDEHLNLQQLESQGVRFDTEFVKLTNFSPFLVIYSTLDFNHLNSFGAL